MYSIIFSKKLTTDILIFIQNSVDISLQQVGIQLHSILLYLVAKIRCSYLAKAIVPISLSLLVPGLYGIHPTGVFTAQHQKLFFEKGLL